MAAESMLLKLGGWVASTAVGFISDQVQYYISDHFQFEPTVKAKLRCLKQDLKKIQAVLEEADKQRIKNSRLGDWLQDIKDATYDAKDVLDMFEYKIIQEKVEGTADDENNIFKRYFTCANSTVKKFIVSGDVVKKLNEVVDKFEEIAGDRDDIIKLIDKQPAVSQWVSEIMQSRVTTSMPIKSKVFGRDKERAQLIKLLNQSSGDGGGSSSSRNSSRNFHVLPVVGIGGVGKTTLVQDVYNNQDVKHLFDLKAWVCVSDNFDVKRLTKEIIVSASISKPRNFHLLENLDKIQQILQRGLKDKRFLIVLDDIWNEDATKWEQLQSVLNYGKEGSRVVITTRSPTIADMMGTTETTLLEGLADEEFQSFFASCAFGEENPASHPGLKIVAEKIAKKLKGNPLAAKTVGALLKQKLKHKLNGQYWKEVLHNELWQTDQQENGIMQALRLSYEYLPSYLKQCFVYCSLFPKDYEYEKTKLVRMWIAHDFILPNEQHFLENIGEDYFNELLSRSFIHKTTYGYVIHDLLHDLAQSLSDGEIYIAENDEAHISSPKKKVRHISICSNYLSQLCNDNLGNENLRSLVVFDCSFVEKNLDVLSKLKGLRVLVLHKFPVSLKFIQKMLHLRYLEISSDHWDRPFNMPELVCKLYHLQVLRVRRYDTDESCVLPNEINRLIKLRHLEAGTTKGIAWIGSLTLLQELNFEVNQREKGFDIGQIRDLSELRRLSLYGLETVKTKEEASQAMLKNKEYLKDLKLFWKEGHHINLLHNEEEEEVDIDVLQGLQPHRNLEELEIGGYGGGGTPSWWNANWASNLITLELFNCSKWEFLPPLGHLPFLKMLRIKRMNAVRSIGSEFYATNSIGLSSKTIFPSLEELTIFDMPELKDWGKIEEGGGGGFELFPRLKYFSVGKCLKLRGSTLQFTPSNFNPIRVEISEMSEISEESISYYKGERSIKILCRSASRLLEWLPYLNLLSSVEHLEITTCEEMRSCFPTELLEEWIQHLTSLHSLCFFCCWELESLPSNLISSLSTLRKLEIVNCHNIKSLPEEGLPASLQELIVVHCDEKLESLPSNLISLSTLRILNIENCPKIKSLPEEGLPASIQELHVSRCYDLAKRCMNEYWQKMIAHIPTFTIDDKEVTEENRKSLKTWFGDYSYAGKEVDKEEEELRKRRRTEE